MIRLNKRLLAQVPLILMLIGFLFIQTAKPLGLTSIVSSGTWIIFISCVFVLFQKIIIRKVVDIATIALYLLIITTLFTAFCYSDFSYSTIVVVGCFLEIPILMCAFTKDIEKSIRKMLFYFNIVLSLFYVVISLSPLAHLYTTAWGAKEIPELTLSYNNPNETAMYLFACVVVLASMLPEAKNKIFRIFVSVDICYLIYLIILTKSRTIIFVTAIFLFLIILYNKKSIPKYFRIIAFCIPVVFMTIVLYFRDNLKDYIILGDTFDTGRDSIYSRVFDDLNFLEFLFGDFSFKFQNLHNAVISIFGTIGILGTILFYYFLLRKFKDINIGNTTSVSRKRAFIGLLCIVLITSTEAAFFTAGSAFSISVFSIYLLALPSEESSTPKSTITNK